MQPLSVSGKRHTNNSTTYWDVIIILLLIFLFESSLSSFYGARYFRANMNGTISQFVYSSCPGLDQLTTLSPGQAQNMGVRVD